MDKPYTKLSIDGLGFALENAYKSKVTPRKDGDYELEIQMYAGEGWRRLLVPRYKWIRITETYSRFIVIEGEENHG